jgi:hypothetical protein
MLRLCICYVGNKPNNIRRPVNRKDGILNIPVEPYAYHMTVTNQKTNILCDGDEGKEAEKERRRQLQANTRVRAD